jgi:transglutaminase-like putative cysteine protease
MTNPNAVNTSGLMGGDAGVEQTFDAMARLANAGQSIPVVVDFARALATNSGASQARGALAIYNWLARTFKYVDDPVDTELLISPAVMIQAAQANGVIRGDCDEAAILGASLGKAVGIEAQFTALAFEDDPDRLSHVFAVLLPNDGAPVSLDVTRPRGKRLPAVTRTLSMPV